jgi:hypothetical protein
MEQTSIEWLESQLTEYLQRMYKFEIDQAKEMHKQEIIDAYHINPLETKWENIGKQYYAETYGK